MKQHKRTAVFLWVIFYIAIFAIISKAQVTETITGTVLSYGTGLNTRARTSPFTLTIKGHTSDDRAQSLLRLLQDEGQDALLKGIEDTDLGRFSINNNVGVTINAVHETNVDGKRRLYIVFERWMQFAELRGGYRSRDYPFGFIDLYIDPETGRGEGTYIAAARIRWRDGNGGNGPHVEVEDFATFPAKLLSVRARPGRP